MPGPTAAASSPPPSASTPFAMIPSSRPRQPTWRTASAGRSPFMRAIATGRQSAVTSIIPCPGSSLHQPSQAWCCVPGVRTPSGEAFRTSAPCCCHAMRVRSGSMPVRSASSRRFSTTRAGSSPVRIPRFNDSYGPSLTPPSRVEKTTVYDPAPSQRITSISSRFDRSVQTAARAKPARPEVDIASDVSANGSCGADQLPCRRQLRLAAVELAVQLPATELRQDLADLRRFPESQAGEVGAADLEFDVAKALKILVQRLRVGERQGEERRVRRIGLGECNDLGRLELLAVQALDEARPDGDRPRDPLGIAALDLQPTQPVIELVGRQPPRQRLEAEPPPWDPGSVAGVELTQPLEERDCLLVRGEMRVDRGAGAELREPEDRRTGVSLLEQRDQLIAQPCGREVADEAHLDRPAGEPLRVLVHPELVAALVADCSEDPGRIVDEREVVEEADRLRVEVAASVERVDESAEVLALERDGHRIDREVAAEEVLADRRVLDARQRRRRVVELRARGDDVDALVVAVHHYGRAELAVGPHASAEAVGDGARERDCVALHRDVDVEVRLAEQDVAHGAADEVDA